MESSHTSAEIKRPNRRKRPTVPDHQRKRVRSACMQCRRNKLKCDGNHPCKRCEGASLACQFPEPSFARPALGERSERELILESILRRHNIFVSNDIDALRQYSDKLLGPRESVEIEETCRRQDFQREAENFEPLVDNLNGCNDAVDSSHTDVEDSSVVVEHIPTPQTHVHDQSKTHFNGGFSAWAFFQSVRKTVERDGQAQSSSDKQLAYRHFILDTSEVLLGDFRSSLLAALPPRDILDFLSSTFFRYAQCNFFFVHPAIFSRKLDMFLAGTYEFDGQSGQGARRSIEFVCVLFMVLALGSQYADLEQKSGIPSSADLGVPVIESVDLSRLKIPKLKPHPGWRFYQVSKHLLSEMAFSCSMTSIQACGLHGAFLITTSAHDIAYNVYGLAARMSVNMGLHRSVGSEVLHPHVKELRNRLWWTIYTHERLFGFWLGRPNMFDDNEIDTPFPENLPELQAELSTGSVDGQIALIKLCQIMGRIVKNIYPSTRSLDKGQLINTSTFIELQDALESWNSELPEKLNLSRTSARGTVHLHLTHRHAIMLLTRMPLSHAAGTKGLRTPAERHKDKFLKNAAKACISAAMSTIELLDGLRHRGLLCQHSCQDPLYCTAALCVLLLGAKLEPPGSQMKKTVLKGVVILQQLAQGSETAASSLEGIVRGFQKYFEGNNRRPQPAAESAGHNPRARSHKAWQTWMQQSDNSSPSQTTKRDERNCNSLAAGYSPDGSDFTMGTWIDPPIDQDMNVGARTIHLGEESQMARTAYQHLAFDNALDDWNGGNYFWFSELDSSFEGLGILHEFSKESG